MLPKPLRVIWGDLTASEAKRFGLLSLALMFTIGPYWMLRGVREAIFIDFVGVRWQPWGKILSFLLIIPIVLLYSKLVDYVRKEKLFYVIYPIYISAFSIFAFFVAYPEYSPQIQSIPGNIVGWFSYVVFESFGIFAAALFWSFVATQTTTDLAKRGYGMIISITQIGTILGTFFVSQYSQKLGLPTIIMISAAGIAIVPFIIRLFVMHHSDKRKERPGFFRTTKQKTGFFEGLRLLIREPYLLGVFVISTGYEIVGAMLEFQMNIFAHEIYPTKELFTEFYARYGMYTNGLTLLFALFGTSFFLRKFGLRICLLLFPVATGIIICSNRLFSVLPVVFVSMVVLKGLSYALNNPAKEILYIPATRDVKFKAKSWIDVFGIKSMKVSGAGLNAIFRHLPPVQTIAYTTPILLCLVVGWAFVARLVSVKHHNLVEKNKIIGE
jgi:AAA family ATP:ADP antiporter